MSLFKSNKSNPGDTPAGLLTGMFAALGDSTRFQIVRLLQGGEDICVSEIADRVGITTSGVSQQLKVLEVAGLVSRERNGQKICYRLRKTDPIVRKLVSLVNN